MAEIRDGIGRVGRAVRVPAGPARPAARDRARSAARPCLAEEALSGRPGRGGGLRPRRRGRASTACSTRSTIPAVSSFLRHQYPSTLPDRRCASGWPSVSRRVIAADRPRRHHLQHRVLLRPDDRRDQPAGDQPAALAVARRAVRVRRRRRPTTTTCSRLALGDGPRPAAPAGPVRRWPRKWYLRRFADGVRPRGSRPPDEIARIERDIPACTVDVTVDGGRSPVGAPRPGQLQLRAGPDLHRRATTRTS